MRREGGGERGGRQVRRLPPPSSPRSTGPSLPPTPLPSDKKTVRHGRSDCGLVEAVSVSGSGNALINPVRVKDTGACKADPGFVLHCLCFQSDCYNLD